MKNQKVKIKIEFEDKELWEYNRTFTIELFDSPAFQYGNGTSVVVTSDKYKDDARLIDTRYDTGILTHFEEWCIDWLKNNFNPHKSTIIK